MAKFKKGQILTVVSNRKDTSADDAGTIAKYDFKDYEDGFIMMISDRLIHEFTNPNEYSCYYYNESDLRPATEDEKKAYRAARKKGKYTAHINDIPKQAF